MVYYAGVSINLKTDLTLNALTFFQCKILTCVILQKCFWLTKNMKMQTGNFAKQPKKAQNGGKKAYGCNQCNYASDWPNKLKCHMLVHSGEKPFSCIQCNNSAARAFDLKSHMLIHSGEKTFHGFKCSKCSYSCTRAYKLEQHI